MEKNLAPGGILCPEFSDWDCRMCMIAGGSYAQILDLALQTRPGLQAEVLPNSMWHPCLESETGTPAHGPRCTIWGRSASEMGHGGATAKKGAHDWP